MHLDVSALRLLGCHLKRGLRKTETRQRRLLRECLRCLNCVLRTFWPIAKPSIDGSLNHFLPRLEQIQIHSRILPRYTNDPTSSTAAAGYQCDLPHFPSRHSFVFAGKLCTLVSSGARTMAPTSVPKPDQHVCNIRRNKVMIVQHEMQSASFTDTRSP